MVIGDDASSSPSASSRDETVDDDKQCMKRSSTFVDEMRTKYLSTQKLDDKFFVKQLAGVDPCKVASERNLELIVLNFKEIRTIGNQMSFMSFCTNAREVDVAWNKLSSWSEIGLLLTLPNLRVLNVSHNPVDSCIKVDLPVSQAMEILILNGTCLPMTSVRELVSKMPNLSQLHLAENRGLEDKLGVESVTISDSVDTINISDCDINNWDTVITLHEYFPNCSSLILCNNPIDSIALQQNAKMHSLDGIRYLSMNNCLIDDWAAIEKLAEIKTLRELRIALVPLLKNNPSDNNFYLIVGRIPQLQVLNGSIINNKLREESERFFIRYYDSCEVKPKMFTYLVARHGHVAQLCHVDMTPKQSAKVSVICEEIGYYATMEIRLSQNVSWLSEKLEKVTNIPAHCMRLFFISGGCPFPEELRIPSRKLATFHIEDGDQLLVQARFQFLEDEWFLYQ